MIETALLAARLLLALIFAVAGVTKLADRAGSRQAVIDFGLPTSLAAPVGILLPLAELTVAAALIPAATAWWGALGALGLLLLFVGGIAVNLARGRRPDCHCFGQLHSAPAGWATLARNALFAAVAGFILWQGRDGAGPGMLAWLGSQGAAWLAGIVVGLVVVGVLAAQWLLLLNLLRQNGRLLRRIEALEDGTPSLNGGPPVGLPVGVAAPDFQLPDLDGEARTLGSLLAPGKPLLLLFTDPGCGPCKAMLPQIARWQEDHADDLTISLVSTGTPEENRTEAGHVLLQEDWETAELYEVDGTPSAVLVHPDATIGSRVTEGAEQIETLVARAAAVTSQPPILKLSGNNS